MSRLIPLPPWPWCGNIRDVATFGGGIIDISVFRLGSVVLR